MSLVNGLQATELLELTKGGNAWRTETRHPRQQHAADRHTHVRGESTEED